MMKHGVIAGPYVPIYAEVTRKLAGVKSMSARWVYIVLVTTFAIQEDWGDDPVWVSGLVRANKIDIASESGVNYPGFYQLWQQLIEAGLVREREDGLFVLPFYKKKAYDSISAMEVRERLSRLEANLKKDQEKPDQEADDPPEKPDDPPEKPDDPPEKPEVHPFKEERKNSLSVDKIVSMFYRGIGQKRISKQKRERGKRLLKKLRKEGFSLEDIAFAVEWTLENAKQEPYDISIIEHTIGQAAAAREKTESKRRVIEESDKALEEERARQKREEKEREQIESYKGQLEIEEREALREEAETELVASGEYKKQFISDLLIGIKENEILRKRLEEQR